MIGKLQLKSLREKKYSIKKRLIELNYLPNDNNYSEEQQVIINQLNSFDFSFWEKVKEERGLGVKQKLTLHERQLSDKRARVRSWFRLHDYLPEYGSVLTKEQQDIIDQVERNDFSFFEECKEKHIQNMQQQNIKRSKGMVAGTIVQMEVPINGKSKKELKKTQGYTITSEPINVFSRLRMVQILPPIGEELTPQQQEIVDDVNLNWFGKTKLFFIKKYIHLSTPEGRLYYRLYMTHRKEGYRFNIKVEDIKIPEICPLLNIPLSTDPKDKDKPNYYSCDRIDSSKGIVPGNIQVMSLKANKMKNKATEIELLKFATNTLKMLNNV